MPPSPGFLLLQGIAHRVQIRVRFDLTARHASSGYLLSVVIRPGQKLNSGTTTALENTAFDHPSSSCPHTRQPP